MPGPVRYTKDGRVKKRRGRVITAEGSRPLTQQEQNQAVPPSGQVGRAPLDIYSPEKKAARKARRQASRRAENAKRRALQANLRANTTRARKARRTSTPSFKVGAKASGTAKAESPLNIGDVLDAVKGASAGVKEAVKDIPVLSAPDESSPLLQTAQLVTGAAAARGAATGARSVAERVGAAKTAEKAAVEKIGGRVRAGKPQPPKAKTTPRKAAKRTKPKKTSNEYAANKARRQAQAKAKQADKAAKSKAKAAKEAAKEAKRAQQRLTRTGKTTQKAGDLARGHKVTTGAALLTAADKAGVDLPVVNEVGALVEGHARALAENPVKTLETTGRAIPGMLTGIAAPVIAAGQTYGRGIESASAYAGGPGEKMNLAKITSPVRETVAEEWKGTKEMAKPLLSGDADRIQKSVEDDIGLILLTPGVKALNTVRGSRVYRGSRGKARNATQRRREAREGRLSRTAVTTKQKESLQKRKAKKRVPDTRQEGTEYILPRLGNRIENRRTRKRQSRDVPREKAQAEREATLAAMEMNQELSKIRVPKGEGKRQYRKAASDSLASVIVYGLPRDYNAALAAMKKAEAGIAKPGKDDLSPSSFTDRDAFQWLRKHPEIFDDPAFWRAVDAYKGQAKDITTSEIKRLLAVAQTYGVKLPDTRMEEGVRVGPAPREVSETVRVTEDIPDADRAAAGKTRARRANRAEYDAGMPGRRTERRRARRSGQEPETPKPASYSKRDPGNGMEQIVARDAEGNELGAVEYVLIDRPERQGKSTVSISRVPDDPILRADLISRLERQHPDRDVKVEGAKEAPAPRAQTHPLDHDMANASVGAADADMAALLAERERLKADDPGNAVARSEIEGAIYAMEQGDLTVRPRMPRSAPPKPAPKPAEKVEPAPKAKPVRDTRDNIELFADSPRSGTVTRTRNPDSIRKTLSKTVNVEGRGKITRQEFIEQLVDEGRVLAPAKKGDGQVLLDPKTGMAVAQAQLTKTGMKYAEYLIERRTRKAEADKLAEGANEFMAPKAPAPKGGRTVAEIEAERKPTVAERQAGPEGEAVRAKREARLAADRERADKLDEQPANKAKIEERTRKAKESQAAEQAAKDRAAKKRDESAQPNEEGWTEPASNAPPGITTKRKDGPVWIPVDSVVKIGGYTWGIRKVDGEWIAVEVRTGLSAPVHYPGDKPPEKFPEMVSEAPKTKKELTDALERVVKGEEYRKVIDNAIEKSSIEPLPRPADWSKLGDFLEGEKPATRVKAMQTLDKKIKNPRSTYDARGMRSTDALGRLPSKATRREVIEAAVKDGYEIKDGNLVGTSAIKSTVITKGGIKYAEHLIAKRERGEIAPTLKFSSPPGKPEVAYASGPDGGWTVQKVPEGEKDAGRWEYKDPDEKMSPESYSTKRDAELAAQEQLEREFGDDLEAGKPTATTPKPEPQPFSDKAKEEWKAKQDEVEAEKAMLRAENNADDGGDLDAAAGIPREGDFVTLADGNKKITTVKIIGETRGGYRIRDTISGKERDIREDVLLERKDKADQMKARVQAGLQGKKEPDRRARKTPQEEVSDADIKTYMDEVGGSAPAAASMIKGHGLENALAIHRRNKADRDAEMKPMPAAGGLRHRMEVMKLPTKLKTAINKKLGDGRPGTIRELVDEHILADFTVISRKGPDGKEQRVLRSNRTGRVVHEDMIGGKAGMDYAQRLTEERFPYGDSFAARGMKDPPMPSYKDTPAEAAKPVTEPKISSPAPGEQVPLGPQPRTGKAKAPPKAAPKKARIKKGKLEPDMEGVPKSRVTGTRTESRIVDEREVITAKPMSPDLTKRKTRQLMKMKATARFHRKEAQRMEPGSPEHVAAIRAEARATKKAGELEKLLRDHKRAKDQAERDFAADTQAVIQRENLEQPAYVRSMEDRSDALDSKPSFQPIRTAYVPHKDKDQMRRAGKSNRSYAELMKGSVLEPRLKRAMHRATRTFVAENAVAVGGKKYLTSAEIRRAINRGELDPDQYAVFHNQHFKRAIEDRLVGQEQGRRADMLIADWNNLTEGHPLTRSLDELEKIEQEVFGRTLHKGHKYAVVRKAAADEYAHQFTGLDSALAKLNRNTSRIILGYNPSWAAAQILAEGIPGAVAIGGNPARWARVIKAEMDRKKLDRRDVSASDAIAGQAPGSLAFPAPGMRSSLYDRQVFGRRRGKERENPVTTMEKVQQGVASAAVGEALGKFDRAKGGLIRRAVVNAAVDREYRGFLVALKNGLDLDREVKAALKGKSLAEQTAYLAKHPKTARQLENYLDDVMGNWRSITKLENGPASLVAFYPYVRYSLKSAFWGFPKRHPIKATMMAFLSQQNAEQLEALLGDPGGPAEWLNLAFPVTYADGKPQVAPVGSRIAPALNAFISAIGAGEPGRALTGLNPALGVGAQFLGMDPFTGEQDFKAFSPEAGLLGLAAGISLFAPARYAAEFGAPDLIRAIKPRKNPDGSTVIGGQSALSQVFDELDPNAAWRSLIDIFAPQSGEDFKKENELKRRLSEGVYDTENLDRRMPTPKKARRKESTGTGYYSTTR